MPNDHKTPKIIQLTTPFDRFQKFDRKADQVLKLLDEMGDLYIDLGFRESDVEDYNKEQANQLKEELIQHGQLVLGLLQHPVLQILRERREAVELGNVRQLFEVPTGVWQHYKGTRYEMLGPIQSTDYHAPGVMYQEEGKPNSRIYTITLSNFYRHVSHNRETVKRFTQVSE